MNRRLPWWSVWLIGLLAPLAPAASPPRGAAQGFCVVCGKPVAGEALEIHQGRRIHACPGACAAAWQADPERWFGKLQARGGLYDERGLLGDLVSGWMWAGGYVLLCLLGGGACAYLAVSHGRPARAWFLAGLAFHVLALLVLVRRVRGAVDAAAAPVSIPAGLAKVPTTRAPLACPRCAAAHHPAAAACAQCGATLTPAVEAEHHRT